MPGSWGVASLSLIQSPLPLSLYPAALRIDHFGMTKQIWLTGITPSGTPHLGNYVGAIRPAIAASQRHEQDGFYFLADYHGMIKNQDPALLRQSRQEIAASWLALGLDTDHATFYRQSDIPCLLYTSDAADE